MRYMEEEVGEKGRAWQAKTPGGPITSPYAPVSKARSGDSTARIEPFYLRELWAPIILRPHCKTARKYAAPGGDGKEMTTGSVEKKEKRKDAGASPFGDVSFDRTRHINVSIRAMISTNGGERGATDPISLFSRILVHKRNTGHEIQAARNPLVDRHGWVISAYLNQTREYFSSCAEKFSPVITPVVHVFYNRK